MVGEQANGMMSAGVRSVGGSRVSQQRRCVWGESVVKSRRKNWWRLSRKVFAGYKRAGCMWAVMWGESILSCPVVERVITWQDPLRCVYIMWSRRSRRRRKPIFSFCFVIFFSFLLAFIWCHGSSRAIETEITKNNNDNNWKKKERRGSWTGERVVKVEHLQQSGTSSRAEWNTVWNALLWHREQMMTHNSRID